MRRCFAATFSVVFLVILVCSSAFSLTDSWISRGLQGGIWALAVTPSNPNILYASNWGGVFKSTDAGRTWTQLLEYVTASMLAVHPANPDIVFASCYMPDYRHTEFLRSTDGGNTWVEPEMRSSRSDVIPGSLRFNPENPDIVYAVASETVLRSTDGGRTWSDDGSDLRQRLTQYGCGPWGCGLGTLVLNPRDPDVLYAAGWGYGIWKSTNGGITWTFSSGDAMLINSLAISTANPTVLLAATEYGVFRSIDAGHTWTGTCSPPSAWDIVIDPLNPHVVYAGLESGVVRSADGGVNWTPMDAGLPRDGGVRVLAIDSQNPPTVYAGTQQGVYAFSSKATPGLTTLYFPRLAARDSADSSTDDSEHTVVSIVNHASVGAELTFTAYRDDGSLVSGGGIANPVTWPLKAGAQMVATEAEIWGDGLAAASPSGWFKMESTSTEVTGSFRIFNDTHAIVDAAVPSIFKPLYRMAATEIEPDGFTLIRVVNPHLTVARFWVELYDRTGNLTGKTRLHDLGPECSFEESLASLFPGYTPSAHDHVVVWATSPVLLFESMGKTGGLTQSLNGQDTAGGAGKLYLPQYVTGSADWSTAISIVNEHGTAATAGLRLIGDDGAQIGATRTLTVPAFGKAYIEDPSLFLSPVASLVQGYVEITSLGPEPVPLLGSVTFGDPAGDRFGTALPLTGELMTDFVFGQVSSGAGWFTGIALVNPNADAVTATVRVHDTSGAVIGTTILFIPAGQRVSKLLTEYFPDLAGKDISSGYIRLATDKGIAALAVYGASDLSSLAALPPEAVR